VTWSARIEHTSSGLALTFPEPLSRLDMSNDVAAHLASLLAIEARQQVAGVVRTLTIERSKHPLCCDCENCLNGITEGTNAKR